MAEEELFLLTKLDMAGEPLGPSLRFRCEANDAALRRIIGELTGFSPEKRDGTPNPNCIPFCRESCAEGPNILLEWDDYYNYCAGDGKRMIRHCAATYFREDIEPYYFQLENLDRIRQNPRYQAKELALIGSEDRCMDA